MSRALVVDDSSVGRLITSRLVRAAGWDVVEAVDGRDALVKLEKQSMDVVLLDLLMPSMNGMDVLRELSRRRSCIRVAVITADVQQATRDACVRLGAYCVINKPLTQVAVEELLNSTEASA